MLLKQSNFKMLWRGTTINCKQNCSDGLTEKCVSNECKIDLRDLNAEYFEYFSLDPVGGGSYGQCLHAC